MKIGFIGLGAMGRPIAARLQRAGHQLTVHDLRRDAARALVDEGAHWADRPAQAAAGAEALFTSLPGPAEVESVACGAGGIQQALGAGSVWFDLTTNSPDCVRQLHAIVRERNVELLDAPVSGGPRGAKSGKLALWVGGNRDTYDRYLALLHTVGDQPCYVGAIGAGSVAKLAHNCATFSIQTALAEVMSLGVKAGVEPAALFRAIRQGASGRVRTFDRLPDHFLAGRFDPPAFPVHLAHKDMLLALALARRHDVPMRVAEGALGELEEAMRRGWGHRDSRIAMTLQEERAGVTVRVPEDQLRTLLD